MVNPIIAALDVSGLDAALALAKKLAPVVGAFKVGSELFTAVGPEVLRRLRDTGVPVFLDLKFHDIPHTVARAVAAAVQWDVQMLTVHTSGGSAMLSAAVQSALESAGARGCPPPLVLGVTVLTSLNQDDLAALGCGSALGAQVERLARLAVRAGLKGLVCSPMEIAPLRRVLPPELQLVTPGIRASAEARDDQKRTLSPREALAAGGNWLVIGRPICAAPDPRAAAETILGGLG